MVYINCFLLIILDLNRLSLSDILAKTKRYSPFFGGQLMKRRIRIAAVLIIIVLIIVQATPIEAASFTDVSAGLWYYDAVMTLSNLSIINGFPDGSFQPDGTLTIGQFLKLVAVAMYPRDIPEVKEGRIYYDTDYSFPADHWAAPYYYAALFKGMIKRDEFPIEHIDALITRYQMSIILYNLQKNIFGIEHTPAEGLEDYILDYDKIPEKYLTYVRASYASGLLQGDESQYFNGSQSLTRAQGATVLMRLIYPATRLPVNFWSDAQPVENPNPVTDDWFSDAVIFGNSLVGGIMSFSSLDTPDYIYKNGISVFQVSDYECFPYDGKNITLMDALSKKSYKKILIQLGVNELGYKPTQFYAEYSAMILEMKKIQPGATIYIQTILPITESKVGGTFSIERIVAFNNELKRIATEHNCVLVDTYSFFADQNGYMPASYSYDGVHLVPYCYDLWVNFLKNTLT